MLVPSPSASSSALRHPTDLDGIPVQVGASIGASLAPGQASDVSGLLKRADVAMYAAKSAGGGVRVFDADLDTSSPARLALVTDLRAAIDDHEISIHVQPKADLATGGVAGVEVLARWDHPSHGVLGPDDFIPLAEKAGLMQALTEHVLDLALDACAGWLRDGLSLGVAVNLSARSLADDTLAGVVADLLMRHEVPAPLLTLEITESTVMSDPTRSIASLHALRALGVRLAIDDFGIGHSSLSNLRHLPVHQLKVDKSFVKDLGRDVEDLMIVRSIVDLGRNLRWSSSPRVSRPSRPGTSSPARAATRRRAISWRARCPRRSSPAGSTSGWRTGGRTSRSSRPRRPDPAERSAGAALHRPEAGHLVERYREPSSCHVQHDGALRRVEQPAAQRPLTRRDRHQVAVGDVCRPPGGAGGERRHAHGHERQADAEAQMADGVPRLQLRCARCAAERPRLRGHEHGRDAGDSESQQDECGGDLLKPGRPGGVSGVVQGAAQADEAEDRQLRTVPAARRRPQLLELGSGALPEIDGAGHSATHTRPSRAIVCGPAMPSASRPVHPRRVWKAATHRRVCRP